MSSELHARSGAATARLTAAGSPFDVIDMERGGVRMPGFRHAPEHVVALFDRYCAEHRDREFLIDGDVRLTFGEVHALARRTAACLIADYDIQRGDRVAIAGRNSANWIIAYMGVLMAGGCATLINGWWSGEEIVGGLELAGCSLLLADPERAERLAEKALPVRMARFEHGHPQTGLATVLGGGQAELPSLSGEDIATIVFTSGSTGIAKGAVSDHFALAQAATSFAAAARQAAILPQAAPGNGQAALLNMPLFHVAGEVALLLPSFIRGRKLVVMPAWDAREAMRLIERERVTSFLGVPLMVMEIACHPDRGRYDLSSCEVMGAGGAPAPAELGERVREGLPGTWPMQGYALTETNSVGCINFAQDYLAEPGSVGRPGSPTVEIAILGPDGSILPPGMRGEVAIRSICNFREYWRNPEETAAAIRHDGFFLTGDLGHLDEHGYLFIVDRKKDLIIRGGENISPIEVEQQLYTHPQVAEASVFGLPHWRYGEVPVAVVSAQHGEMPEEHHLLAHVAAAVASFKVPVRVWCERTPLPRLGSGKIDKLALKARYSQNWEAARAAS